MDSSQATHTKVFISYSHADREWLEQLKRHLRPLDRDGSLVLWDDTHIQPGDDWKEEIRTALDGAQAAVLLISADFFASEFINETELPPLLDAAKAKGVRILPVILSACRFARHPNFARFQAVNSPDRPLNKMQAAEQEEVLDRLAQTIESAFQPSPRPGDLDVQNEKPSQPTQRRGALDVELFLILADFLRHRDSNRHRMLAKVRRDWIDGYLKHSLDNLGLIELRLEEKPGAVSRPSDLVVQQPNQAPRSLPPAQDISAIFDGFGQALLIRGAPGTGKTTLLLELARDLLDRALRDATHPIPVVFHLASWTLRRRNLVDWLVEELAECYYVPRKLAQDWIDTEQVLPLLDGLDEVAPEHRGACVEAINTFRGQHPLVPLAVCSRVAEYEALSVRVELFGAVIIQPLSRAQIGAYLKGAGKPLAGVRWVLREDETLWELLDTPLMLSIVALAYQGRSASEVRAAGSLEQRRTYLFKNYIESRFKRGSEVPVYTREQTLHWLSWLARSLMQNNLSVLYVERMQPDWLPSRTQRWIMPMVPIMSSWLLLGLVYGLLYGLAYGLAGGLAHGMVYGLAGGLVFGLTTDQIVKRRTTPSEGIRRSLQNVSIGLLIAGVVGMRVGAVGEGTGGLLLGLAGGLGLVGWDLGRITPAEALRWSWRKARSAWVVGLAGGLAGGLAIALVMMLIDSTRPNPVHVQLGAVVFLGLVGGVAGGLIGGLIFGLTTEGSCESEQRQNERIRRSLRNTLISLLIGGLVCGLVGGLFDGLFGGLFGGLILGLQNGGFAVIKHYMLRCLMWCNGYAPLNYVRFLDYAAERVFLRKVGGGYIFTHQLLMEYFATLPPSDGARQTKTA